MVRGHVDIKECTGKDITESLYGCSRLPLRSSVRGTRFGGYTAKINSGLGLIAKYNGLDIRVTKRNWSLVDMGREIRFTCHTVSRKVSFVLPSSVLLSLGAQIIHRPRKGTTYRKCGLLSYFTGFRFYHYRGVQSMHPLSAFRVKRVYPQTSGVAESYCRDDMILDRLLAPSMYDIDVVGGSGLFGFNYSKQPDLIEAWSPDRSPYASVRVQNPKHHATSKSSGVERCRLLL